MTLLHEFKREERYPSYFVNRLQDFISASRTDLRLTRKNNTEVEVAPAEPYGIAAIDLQGLWRFRETAVARAHPGGIAGTYVVWAVGTKQKIAEVPKPFTDETDYKFDLRITAGPNPEGAGVEVFEKIGEIDWDGAKITALRQTYNAVSGQMIQDGALSSEAAAGSDITWTREPNGAWVPALKANSVGAAELADESVDTAALIALAVTEAKIAAEAITSSKLGGLSVTEPKIAALAVTTAKLAALAVTEEKIGGEAVSTAKIKLLAITSALLAAEAVTTGKIQNLAVTAGKLGEEAVETAKIKLLAVTAATIANEAIETGKIKNLAVTAAKLAAEAVETGKIQNLAVTAAKIAESTITRAKLASTARAFAWYQSVSKGETFFFEQPTYKYMDSVENVVIGQAGSAVIVGYDARIRSGANGVTLAAAIFIGENQLKVPANNVKATPTIQEVSVVTGVNFSEAWSYIFTTPTGLATTGINTTTENSENVETGQALGVTGLSGGFVVIKGLPVGTYTIGIKMKGTSSYVRAKERTLLVGVGGNSS